MVDPDTASSIFLTLLAACSIFIFKLFNFAER